MQSLNPAPPQLCPESRLDVVDLPPLGRGGVVGLVAAHDHHRVVKVAAVLGQLAEDLLRPLALPEKNGGITFELNPVGPPRFVQKVRSAS